MDNAEDFVQFACNEDWFNTCPYELLPIWTKFIDGFGFETDIDFDLNTYQSMLLFNMGLVNARPYNVKAPMLPSEQLKAANKSIAVYPNPAIDAITIGTLNATDGWEEVEIFNAASRLVKSQKIIKGQTAVQVFVGSLPKGFYVMHIKKKDGAPLGLKFIKN